MSTPPRVEKSMSANAASTSAACTGTRFAASAKEKAAVMCAGMEPPPFEGLIVASKTMPPASVGSPRLCKEANSGMGSQRWLAMVPRNPACRARPASKAPTSCTKSLRRRRNVTCSKMRANMCSAASSGNVFSNSPTSWSIKMSRGGAAACSPSSVISENAVPTVRLRRSRGVAGTAAGGGRLMRSTTSSTRSMSCAGSSMASSKSAWPPATAVGNAKVEVAATSRRQASAMALAQAACNSYRRGSSGATVCASCSAACSTRRSTCQQKLADGQKSSKSSSRPPPGAVGANLMAIFDVFRSSEKPSFSCARPSVKLSWGSFGSSRSRSPASDRLSRRRCHAHETGSRNGECRKAMALSWRSCWLNTARSSCPRTSNAAAADA
mmetsp:Transcript_1544/g.4184  ORF Transcript_1544/g.4184 Transcript_1544/m.4184 type:complete len:382 (-) Transcript_1544:42-1187(-)